MIVGIAALKQQRRNKKEIPHLRDFILEQGFTL
jgi:hypothetical protein